MIVAGSMLVVAHALAPTAVWRAVCSLAALSSFAAAAWLRGRVADASLPSPWRWVAAGLGGFLVGDVVWGVLQVLVDDTSSPARHLAAVGYLAGYLAIGWGLLALTRTHAGQRGGVDLSLDTAIVAVATGAVAAQLLRPDLSGDATSAIRQVVMLAYAAAHGLHVVAVVRLLVLPRMVPAVGFAAAGTAALMLTDVGYLGLGGGVTYELGGGHWLETTWLIATALLALAVVHPSTAEVDLRPRAPRDGALRVFVGIGCLATPAVVVALVPHEDLVGGTSVWITVTVVLAALATWRTTRILAARDQADSERSRVSRRYRALAAHSSDAYLLVDATGMVVDTSPTYGEVTGDPSADPIGNNVFRRVAPEDVGRMREAFADLLSSPGVPSTIELRVVTPDGPTQWLAVRAVNLLDDPDVGSILLSMQNVTDRRLAEERLEHNSLHDPVTGAANRWLLADRVHQATVQLDRSGGSVALVIVDLHELGRINERFGHDGGDELLREVHDRLRSTVRASDTVARLGGDDFAVLVSHGGESLDDLDSLTDRMLARLDEPFEIDGDQVVVTATLGLTSTTARADVESLLREAGMALATARRDGPARVVHFVPAMRDEAIDRVRIESDLSVALERGQFELHYQPVLDLQAGGVRGVEALLRWNHPDVGLIPPDRFIPVAERTRLIVPIGEWVIETACRTLAAWRSALGVDLEMNVNVSGEQLSSVALVGCVQASLDETGVPPRLLVLEVTESALVADAEIAASQLRALREVGVRVAIDDFGTGYSSLSYLQQFPVDVLKIDRSFIASVVGDQPVPPLVRGVVELARTLSLETVAEGIEDVGQAMQLRTEGCQLGQGFLFSRPLPEDAALSHLRLHVAGTPSAAVAAVQD